MSFHAILDFPAGDGSRNPLVFHAPREIICADSIGQVRDVIRNAERHARAGAWVAGFVSYDAAPAFDVALRVRGGSGFPLAWFGVFDAPDPVRIEETLPDAAFGAWKPGIDRERFNEDIGAIRQAIFDGDVYQINHTLRLHGRYTGDDLALFRKLQSAQPDSYAAYLNLGKWRVLSVSPELFFRRENGKLTAKPMKGTARRGRYPEEDREFANALMESDKNRAENLMIVDLLRNDLSRVAVPGSIEVSELFAVERHPTVLQMTSTITAQEKPGTSLEEIFTALFPCGSITGAPKSKAMEIIARYEAEPRDIYCGAIGLLRPGGDATFNVAIRTVALNSADSSAVCGIGSGVLWDSSADDEYEEVLLKSHFLSREMDDFQLLETLRMEAGRYIRLDCHLARLLASAQYFDRPFDVAACRQKLETVAAETQYPVARARISLDSRGEINVDVSELSLHVEQAATFAIFEMPVSRDSVWLFHKTSRREVFERARAAHPDVFDVLLQNEQGELTEFTRGNLVVQIDGRELTPHRDCGLLDGCLRRELLEQGKIIEARLATDDLARAEHIWFINSLRGRIELFRQKQAWIPFARTHAPLGTHINLPNELMSPDRCRSGD